jgi:hypothetical protein
VSVACGCLCAASLDIVKSGVVQVEVEVTDAKPFIQKGAVILEP